MAEAMRLGTKRGRRMKRWSVVLAMILVCFSLFLAVSAVALAAEEPAVDIPTAEGKEAPALDYELHVGTAAACIALVALFYAFIFWRSEKEFKKVVDGHFGPKKE